MDLTYEYPQSHIKPNKWIPHTHTIMKGWSLPHPQIHHHTPPPSHTHTYIPLTKPMKNFQLTPQSLPPMVYKKMTGTINMISHLHLQYPKERKKVRKLFLHLEYINPCTKMWRNLPQPSHHTCPRHSNNTMHNTISMTPPLSNHNMPNYWVHSYPTSISPHNNQLSPKISHLLSYLAHTTCQTSKCTLY